MVRIHRHDLTSVCSELLLASGSASSVSDMLHSVPVSSLSHSSSASSSSSSSSSSSPSAHHEVSPINISDIGDFTPSRVTVRVGSEPAAQPTVQLLESQHPLPRRIIQFCIPQHGRHCMAIIWLISGSQLLWGTTLFSRVMLAYSLPGEDCTLDDVAPCLCPRLCLSSPPRVVSSTRRSLCELPLHEYCMHLACLR